MDHENRKATDRKRSYVQTKGDYIPTILSSVPLWRARRKHPGRRGGGPAVRVWERQLVGDCYSQQKLTRLSENIWSYVTTSVTVTPASLRAAANQANGEHARLAISEKLQTQCIQWRLWELSFPESRLLPTAGYTAQSTKGLRLFVWNIKHLASTRLCHPGFFRSWSQMPADIIDSTHPGDKQNRCVDYVYTSHPPTWRLFLVLF